MIRLHPGPLLFADGAICIRFREQLGARESFELIHVKEDWIVKDRHTPITSTRFRRLDDRRSRCVFPSDAAHSPDFASVVWAGSKYTFTPMQAAVVKALWDAAGEGTPDLFGAYLLVEVESQMRSNHLAPLFQGNPAWGTMIVRGERRGTYRLNVSEPE